jgi:hypothetical protein
MTQLPLFIAAPLVASLALCAYFIYEILRP